MIRKRKIEGFGKSVSSGSGNILVFNNLDCENTRDCSSGIQIPSSFNF